MSDKPTLFCITSGDQQEKNVRPDEWDARTLTQQKSPDGIDSIPPGTAPVHTAAYSPWLKTRYKLTLAVLSQDNIVVEGYVPDKASGVSAPAESSLTDIKKIDPEFVQRILSSLTREVIFPPTAAIAGVYCRTDNRHGV